MRLPSDKTVRSIVVRERENSASFNPSDADPVSLSTAMPLWERHCPGCEFPALGRPWHCWVHDDETPSAAFFVKDGHVKVHCYGACSRSFALADLYARDLGVETLTRATLPLYYARMRLEFGVEPRPDVPCGVLDAGWPTDAHRLYNGYVEFMACKWLDRPHEPQAFTLSFAATWTGLPVERVKTLWAPLRAAEYVITTEGKIRIGGHYANLYLPNNPDEEKAPESPETGALEGAALSVCQCGCGAEIEQGRGSERKWSSDACRKRRWELEKSGFSGLARIDPRLPYATAASPSWELAKARGLLIGGSL